MMHACNEYGEASYGIMADKNERNYTLFTQCWRSMVVTRFHPIVFQDANILGEEAIERLEIA